MADQRTMAELLCAPTEGYAEAIVVPPIPAEHFELKHSLINLVTSKQLFGFEKEDPHAHIRYFNKITSTLKYKDVPETSIKLMLFPFSIDGPARIWLDKEPSSGFGSTKTTSSDRSVIASIVTSAMIAMFKQHQVTPAPASVKAVEESCVTCGGAHSYRQCPATDGNAFSGYQDNIQGYVSAVAVNYNQGNTRYRPQSVANQIRPSGFAQPNVQNNQTRYNQGYNQNRGINQGNPNYQAPAYQAPIHQPQVVTTSDFSNYMKANDVVMKNMQTQMTSLTNSNIKLKNMFGQFMKINTASTSSSGSLPSNIVASSRGDLKAITTRSGISYDGPPIPPLSSSLPKVVEREPEVTKDTVLPIILKELPEKLRDPGKFLIPCDFLELVECLALADLGRLTTSPSELTLRVDDEAITFKVGQTSRYSYDDVVSINRIDVIDVACEEYAQEVLGFLDSSTSGNPTPSLDPILSTYPLAHTFEEVIYFRKTIKACLTNDSIPPGIDDHDFDPEGDLLLLKKLLNDDPSSPLPPKELNLEELKTIKSSIDDPPELELKDLPSHI
ncbi:hypothetical protein Tco_1197310 [Tanacetum coccineum]